MTKDYVKTWLDIAVDDLKASSLLFESKQYATSFYHFQQASEKGLKAYAFLAKIYRSEKDAYKTSHHPLQVFSKAMREQQTDISSMTNSPIMGIIGDDVIESHTQNLNLILDFLPAKDVIYEYSSKMLDKMLEAVKGLKAAKMIYPENFKDTFRQKMILFVQSIKEIDLERGMDIEAFYQEGIIDDQLLDESKASLQYVMDKSYMIAVLFYSNLISHNHNNYTRYPDLNFNPLKYYSLKKPIVKKLPEFNKHLLTALIRLKELNDRSA